MSSPGRVLSAWFLAGVLVSSTASAQGETAEPPLTEVPEPEQGAEQAAGAMVRVVLTDGQTLRGRLVREGDEAVIIELVSGGRLSIPRAIVREVAEERSTLTSDRGELWFQDVSRSRYFFGPSAVMLRAGEAYFSQKELILSEFGVGITDHITAVVGAVPILWLVPGAGFNGILGVKVGTPLGEVFHVSAGLYGGGFFSGGGTIAGGFGFGTATVARDNWHLSVSLGYPVLHNFTMNRTEISSPIVSLSGNLRLGQHFGLVSENWLIRPDWTQPEFFLLDGIALRFLGERFSVDVGGVWTFTQQGLQLNGVPIPWLDFTYHFDLGGSRRR